MYFEICISAIRFYTTFSFSKTMVYMGINTYLPPLFNIYQLCKSMLAYLISLNIQYPYMQ